MTTTTATQSEKTGQRRTNRWSKKEIKNLFYARNYKASWSRLVFMINQSRTAKTDVKRPLVTEDAVRAQYKRTLKRLKEKGKWINESNIKR